MRPTTSAATPPGSPPAVGLPAPKPGAAKRQRKAPAPLGDVTNLLPPPETPTPAKPRRTGRRPIPAVSSTCSSTASVTPAPKPSSAAVLEGEEAERSVFRSPAISTVYARRRDTEAEGTRRRRNAAASKDKGKGKSPVDAAAGPASCPPLGKSARTNISRKNSMAHATQSISSSAPCHKAEKKRPFSSTPKLPEDFVKKQRAYFADVDAFELPEEEVSESELE